MKTKFPYLFITLALWSAINLQLTTARAQGTAFTYQGQLQNNGAPANGSYDLQFILFNTNQFGFPAAPILTNAAVPVNIWGNYPGQVVNNSVTNAPSTGNLFFRLKQ